MNQNLLKKDKHALASKVFDNKSTSAGIISEINILKSEYQFIFETPSPHDDTIIENIIHHDFGSFYYPFTIDENSAAIKAAKSN